MFGQWNGQYFGEWYGLAAATPPVTLPSGGYAPARRRPTLLEPAVTVRQPVVWRVTLYLEVSWYDVTQASFERARVPLVPVAVPQVVRGKYVFKARTNRELARGHFVDSTTTRFTTLAMEQRAARDMKDIAELSLLLLDE